MANERKPQVGEYWVIKPGIGVSARFGKILSLAPSSKPGDEAYIVNCIEEGENYPFGFILQIRILLLADFDKPTCPPGLEENVRGTLMTHYRIEALADFQKKLEVELQKI